MVKLSFFHLRVTKVKLEKIKLHLKLLIGKLKKKAIRYSRNTVIQDFSIGMIYYTIQNI